MNELIEKLQTIESEIAADRGSFVLFGLFLREDAPNRWDILAAAEWIDDDKSEALRFLANQIQQSLRPSELTKISRIVTFPIDDPALVAIHAAVQVEHGLGEINNSVFAGLPIKRAYIITSQKRSYERSTAHRTP